MKKLTLTYDKKEGKKGATHKIQASLSFSEDVFAGLYRLWRSILTSNLSSKNKAEILKILIFATTIVVIVALFVLHHL